MRTIWHLLAQRPDLAALESLPVSLGVEQGPQDGDRHILVRRLVARELAGPPYPDGPFSHIARAILAYQIFPAWLLTGLLRRVPLEPGDTYGIVFHVLPGLDLLFGGRVTARFDGEESGIWRTGFSFRTVAGHPMVGEETFCVEKDLATGAVTAVLQSWSRPGSWLTRRASWVLRWVQTRASRAALDHLHRLARRSRPLERPCSISHHPM